MIPTIVIFGPPYSGKGTAGAKLAKAVRRFHYVSSGDMIRSARDTDLGREMTQFTEQGKLVPDSLVLRMFNTEIDNKLVSGKYNPSKQILLVDGMWRTRVQAEGLESRFDVRGVYSFANISDAELSKRALARQRSDDTPEAIARRLAQFKSDTLPTLDYFREHNIPIFDVDANRPREDVLGSLILGAYGLARR